MTREERDKALEQGIQNLIQLERQFATSEYGASFNSPAEGTAIVREECQEVAACVSKADFCVQKLDSWTQLHHLEDGIQEAAWIRGEAIQTAIEAIHLAAAADKWIRSAEVQPNRFWEGPGFAFIKKKSSAADTENHSAESATPTTDTDSVPH